MPALQLEQCDVYVHRLLINSLNSSNTGMVVHSVCACVRACVRACVCITHQHAGLLHSGNSWVWFQVPVTWQHERQRDNQSGAPSLAQPIRNLVTDSSDATQPIDDQQPAKFRPIKITRQRFELRELQLDVSLRGDESVNRRLDQDLLPYVRFPQHELSSWTDLPFQRVHGVPAAAFLRIPVQQLSLLRNPWSG